MNGPTVTVIQNDPKVGCGVLAGLLDAWRLPWRLVRADAGEELPSVNGAVIVLGGRMGVHDEDRHSFLGPLKEWLRRLLADQTPLLGICLGGQLLAETAGGTVSSNRYGEWGLVPLTVTADGREDPLFAPLGPGFAAFQWHNDSFTVPSGALHLAASPACPAQAFRLGRAWGAQFHPEVDLALVEAWSRGEPGQARLVADFAAAEQRHRQLAQALFGRFLAEAELVAPS